MTRLIDADALKDEIEKCFFLDGYEAEKIEELIDNAPTVVNEYTKGFADGERSGRNFPLTDEEKTILVSQWLPQGEWIPVSERLPEEEDYRDCYGLPDGCVLWQTDNGDIGFGWYYRSTECWSDLNDNPIKTGKVIAWQPLPKPYKEADNEC